ncbi:MAG: type II secretion system F family protein, partial [Candidatus Hydrogenedentes bacterium]|nr:type II secretion system F family protein [Candidatus Hydrogenedentota bacterium]
ARMVEIKNGIEKALVYPLVVLVVGCGILSFFLVKIVPALGDAFTEFGTGLPCATRFWVNLSSFITHHLPAVVAWLAAFLIATNAALKRISSSESGGYALDWLKLHIPIFGALYSTASLGRLTRSLGVLLACDVPVQESLDVASAAARNRVARRAVMDAAHLMEEGESLSEALASTGYFGYSFCWMLGTGEERGEVDRALFSLADTYETGVGRSGKPAAVVAGHALLVCTFAIVGFLAISMCLPLIGLGLFGIGGG